MALMSAGTPARPMTKLAFREGVELDPEFAAAYALAAECILAQEQVAGVRQSERPCRSSEARRAETMAVDITDADGLVWAGHRPILCGELEEAARLTEHRL